METFASPPAAVSLVPQLYFQLVHTLTALLPPPLDDSPEALRTRNRAAIAKAAAMLPVNADEADLAAQCVAARGQAEDVMRLIRENAGDLALTMRLNAQYASMMRTSVSVRGLLMRLQAMRRKREAIETAADQDARRRQAVEQCMLIVADPDIERQRAASPEAVTEAARGEVTEAARGEVTAAARREAPKTPPSETPVAAPAPHEGQGMEENVPYNKTDSHDVAFETWMSEQPWNQGPDETGLGKHLRGVMTELYLAGRELPANGRESPGLTG